ncbi:MAG: hypothetical protein H6R25_1188 [Proteobacteria bacterium]|nr:hypothetical protein [Pseudomonadota bacterium]
MLSDGLFNARSPLLKVLTLAGHLAQNNNYFTNCPRCQAAFYSPIMVYCAYVNSKIVDKYNIPLN